MDLVSSISPCLRKYFIVRGPNYGDGGNIPELTDKIRELNFQEKNIYIENDIVNDIENDIENDIDKIQFDLNVSPIQEHTLQEETYNDVEKIQFDLNLLPENEFTLQEITNVVEKTQFDLNLPPEEVTLQEETNGVEIVQFDLNLSPVDENEFVAENEETMDQVINENHWKPQEDAEDDNDPKNLNLITDELEGRSGRTDNAHVMMNEMYQEKNLGSSSRTRKRSIPSSSYSSPLLDSINPWSANTWSANFDINVSPTPIQIGAPNLTVTNAEGLAVGNKRRRFRDLALFDSSN